ncbi:flagellar export protein FliJ [Mycetocola sp.]|uniref:flagellar export protein FliJ n=1 Tax=Mycetocola sp. TaxID=1871042 RepID=UPI003988C1A1
MTRTFSLAGLLRLRRIREDQAAGGLAAANSRVRENAARTAQVRDSLDGTGTEVSNSAALHIVSTARASTRSMLAELNALAVLRQAAADECAAEFAVARSQSVRIEKLELRHGERVAQQDLHAEQLVLDEIASRSWFAATGEATA